MLVSRGMFDRASTARVPLSLAVVTLVVLLAVLGTLQYRWVGQVGEAERARLQALARTRVEQLAQDFDREVTRAFASLPADPGMLEGDGGARYAARWERWTARTEHPALVA